MGMLASLRNLVDDAAGACSAMCSAMCSAQCSAQRSAVQFNRVVRDRIAATARPVPRLVPSYPRCTALRCITTRLLLLARLTDMVVVSVCVSRMHVLFVRARATLLNWLGFAVALFGFLVGLWACSAWLVADSSL